VVGGLIVFGAIAIAVVVYLAVSSRSRS